MPRPRGPSLVLSEENKARRTEILAAATRLFERQGFRATSLREVAQELGVSKPVLYHYFPSKDALLEHVYRDVSRAILEGALVIRDSAQPPCEKLMAVVRNHVGYHLGHRAFLTIFWSERKELPPAAFAAVREVERTVGATVVGILQAGIRDGCFRPNLDVILTSNALLGLLTSVYRWGEKAGRLEPELAAGIADLVFPGVLQPHSH